MSRSKARDNNDDTGKIVFVHPSATVDPGARIGKGTLIWHYCHLRKGAQIGQDCIVGQNVYVGPTAVVGNRVKIQNNVSIYDEVTLEDEVFCGPSMVFTNVINPRAFIERKDEFMPTLVRRGATLGANCTILCGTTIGAYAMVGAGAVVTRDVPDHALVLGVPAHQVGWVCRCGVTLDPDGEGAGEDSRDASRNAAEVTAEDAGEDSTTRLVCTACDARYVLEEDTLRPEWEHQPRATEDE